MTSKQFTRYDFKNLLLVVIILFNSMPYQLMACTYTLSMHDSYGDGWNGAYVTVFVNEGLVGNFAALNFVSIAEIEINEGDLLELSYTPGEYEGENTYQLYDPGWNQVFADGPNPQAGLVFSSILDCDSTMVPGGHPCAAIPVDTGCIVVNNTGMPGTEFNPGCANSQGSDIWFTMPAPSPVILALLPIMVI